MENNVKAMPAALVAGIKDEVPLFWVNPDRSDSAAPGDLWGERAIGKGDIEDAARRLRRFRGVLKALFSELVSTDGVIESDLLRVEQLQHALGVSDEEGRIFIKADHSLPIAGSVKARGGVYEVLAFAEKVGLEAGLITEDNPDKLVSDEGRELLSKYSVAVGSTGNLGLSIGVIASALGFDTTVHMSSDAKEWKKKRLRDRGVNVIEHQGDYAAAVDAGRTVAEKDPMCHFVDDESSFTLFAGYSASALHLKEQLDAKGICVDEQHPLFVYIPCGVGGAPGGVAFGLAHVFGPNVHCFFAEPTASACFLVAMQDRSGSHPSVYDLGLDNCTEADGLAVPKASECAVEVMRPTLSGVFTVADDTLFKHVHSALMTEGLKIEPSAAAAFDGPKWLVDSTAGKEYLNKHQLGSSMANSTHVIWTTGGAFVPEEEYAKFVERGALLK